MQEIMMHRGRFVHGGTSINPYNRSHTFIPFLEPSQRFLRHIKFVSPSEGTVEALFTWVTRKFTHRLPGTTKATPADRGAYDSRVEAEKAGITLDILEKLFIQSIVDAYLQEWDHLRRGRRISLCPRDAQRDEDSKQAVRK